MGLMTDNGEYNGLREVSAATSEIYGPPRLRKKSWYQVPLRVSTVQRYRPPPLPGRLSDLRVPLSATIPSGISVPILLHLIIRPKTNCPPISHATSMRLPTLYPSAFGLIKISGLFGFAVTLSTTVRSTHCLLPFELHSYLPESSTLTLSRRRAFLVS